MPYDHYLPFVFQGEEILQTIRGFSFGYDFYAPLRNVAYHIYGIKKRPEKQQSGHRYTENIVLYGNEVKKQACKFYNFLTVFTYTETISTWYL